MNERIGKLAVEAGAHWEHGDWNMPSTVYFSERDLEKFAELIVKECAHIAWLYDEPKLSGHGAIIANSIKKQFGVEE